MNERSQTERAQRYVVEGRVQGVGFRYWVLRSARELGLSGYVRNLANGTVEVAAAGSGSALEDLEERLRQGPPAARVAAVRRQPTGDVPRGGFEIAR